MEAVVTTGVINRAKLQSNHHHQQTKTQFFYRPDALPVAQPTVSKHWRENITFHGLAYPNLTWGLPTLSLTTNSSWLPWVGLPCLSSALWCQYPKPSNSSIPWKFPNWLMSLCGAPSWLTQSHWQDSHSLQYAQFCSLDTCQWYHVFMF